MGQPQYAYGFAHFSLTLCLQYASNSTINTKVVTWMLTWCLNILYTFETFVLKISNIYNLHSKKFIIFSTVCFFSSLFWIFWCFVACAYFCSWGILINFGCINFHKICRIHERKYGYGRQVFSYFSAQIYA